ncbi:MAG: histidine kinase [Hyphomicrobium sp.]|nr:histidine kinase [Hyphomicrobium sp.]
MTRTFPSAIALAALLSLGACSSSPMSAIGSITGSKSVSDTDRVFLMAAGSWDRNRDNNVTCDEWKAYATELFNGADANRDDAVDDSEWGRIVSVDRMFDTANRKYFDASGDGKVTRAEFVDRPNPAFKLMDTANTCSLSGAQVAGARSKTQFDTTGKAPESGDPREKKGHDSIMRQ